MKSQVLSAILLTLPVWAYAQQPETAPIVLKDSKGIIQAIEFPDPGTAITDLEFRKVYLKEGPEDGFVKAMDKQQSRENTDDHFDQFYKHVRVDGAGYNFHYKNGKLFYAQGHFVKIENLGVTPVITPDQARERFALYKQIPAGDTSGFTSELLVKEIASRDSAAHLVFKIYLRSNFPSNDEVGFVDASTGDVLATEPIFTHAALPSATANVLQSAPTLAQPAVASPPASGTFATRYSGSRSAGTDSNAGTFRLLDETRATPIHTWNLEGRTDFATRVEIRDNNNSWTTAEHGPTENDMALDVHWALQQIYDRLHNAYAITSFDNPVTGAGFQINAHIHYGINPTERDNAFWDATNKTLGFGDGAVLFRPLASVDVVAHEYGHGITNFQIGWGNVGDPSYFHEGLSDIWGAIMQHRITGGNIWQIGEQLTLNNPCLRDLQNTNLPNVFRPIANTFGSVQYNANSGNPGIDKYVRSGVLSHWAFLLANGGSGTNDVGGLYNVYGVGMDQLENLIVRAVFGNFLDNTTTYAQVRTGMVNAARALCGNQNGVLVQQVENAWKAVNVGIATQASISGADHLCPSATYTISNLPQGSTVAWSSSNVAAATITSGGVAARVGSFHGSVTLTATISGGCGSIVLKKTISVGKPVATNIAISAPDHCAGTSQLVVATTSGNPASINWSITSGNASNASLSDFANGSASLFTNIADCYGLTLKMSNTCGAATSGTTVCIDNCLGAPKVYPNPAKDHITIAFQQTENRSALPGRIQLYSEKSLTPVQTLSNLDIIDNIVIEDGMKIHLNVGQLPRGTYYLHIIPQKDTSQQAERIRVILD